MRDEREDGVNAAMASACGQPQRCGVGRAPAGAKRNNQWWGAVCACACVCVTLIEIAVWWRVEAREGREGSRDKRPGHATVLCYVGCRVVDGDGVGGGTAAARQWRGGEVWMAGRGVWGGGVLNTTALFGQSEARLRGRRAECGAAAVPTK